MLDGLPDPQTIATGLKRAGAHLARAGYEVVAGVGAFLDEVLNAGDEDNDDKGPTRIEVE